MNLGERSYPIFIRKGLLDGIGAELEKTGRNGKIAVITDLNVWKLYGERLENSLEEKGFEVRVTAVRPGEKSKSLKVLEDVYNDLLDFGMTRGDLIITFGGGVVGDVGGFAASTFLRGIPYVQIPTSLLAQIDSSVGGKVAVNLPRGKNLVGSFYQPEAVYIDPELLKTLDKRYFADGMAEVIKYGCIRDKALFEKLQAFKTEEELFAGLEEVIYTCCRIKKEIVEQDEKDLGERMLLNFGHTIGHAVEKYFDYSGYTHGEAIAIGMYNITRRSEEMGITEKGTAERIKKLLQKYGLPYVMPEMDREKVLETVGLDKKNKGKSINICLLRKIGESFIRKIERSEVEQFI